MENDQSFMQKLKAYFSSKQNDQLKKPAAQPVLSNPDSQQQLQNSLQNAFGTPKTSMAEPQPQMDDETLAQLLALRNLNGRIS